MIYILSQPLWDEEKIVQNGQTEQKSLRTGFLCFMRSVHFVTAPFILYHTFQV